MQWNWEQSDWPSFQWKEEALQEAEATFLHQSGVLVGVARHFEKDDKNLLVVDMITDEALKTSEIEGEYLNRDSVQASIRRNFGLETDNRRVKPAESGIADMVTDLYKNFDKPLTHKTLYTWHKMITNGRSDLRDIGCYRTHAEPMQVVSGPIGNETIHFEAPPSKIMKKEMDTFIDWFIKTAPNGRDPLPALTRAGIAHLYFVSIHPFEDGNGRIGRALAEKAMAECLGEPTLIALSQTIEAKRKLYYQALELNNKNNEITNWLLYFAQTVLQAQSYSLEIVDFLIEKTKFYDRARNSLNERQDKVIARMFREGPSGFKGGLSAEKYLSITGTSRATATRDLQDLVEKNMLVKVGELKSTRYHLNIKSSKQKRSRES
ncbi:MAG: Fic family protein [Proteobacteria bacterium]|nr:Fic family protein [Pseudomonadota bacterium]